MSKFIQRKLLILAGCAMLIAPVSIAAEMSKTVAGMEIFYGVVPAQVVARSAQAHDPKMHGGKLRSPGSHHLVVSLFDVKSGERISDATVTATVTPLGMARVEKQLDPMQINDTTSYGNFFDFPASSAPFRIAFKITRPAILPHNAVTAEFEYRPFQGK